MMRSDPTGLTLVQSADKSTITATWNKTATDLTTTTWDVTSDRPVFGHKFVSDPTKTTTWKTDVRSCDTGWMYTVTGYDANGARVGQPNNRLFFPACPPDADAPQRVSVVNVPQVTVANTPFPVTVQGPVALSNDPLNVFVKNGSLPVNVGNTPLPVREVSPQPYPSMPSSTNNTYNNYTSDGSSIGPGMEDRSFFGEWSGDYSMFLVQAVMVTAAILLLVMLYLIMGRKALRG